MVTTGAEVRGDAVTGAELGLIVGADVGLGVGIEAGRT